MIGRWSGYEELQHGTYATSLGKVLVTVVAADVSSLALSGKCALWL